MQNLITVPFHGTNLSVVEINGLPYTPMKPIVEGMGLGWSGQHEKLQANQQRWGIRITRIPSASGDQEALCLPLRKLPGWLMSIHPSRLKPEIRANVITYQNECDDALWDYWTKGVATNPNYRPEETREVHQSGLTLDQQDAVKAHHKALVQCLPKDKQGAMAVRLWSSVKKKFGVSYKDVPPADFTNIISLMSRVAVEGELLPPEAPKPDPTLATDLGMIERNLNSMGDDMEKVIGKLSRMAATLKQNSAAVQDRRMLLKP